mgnify:CR=1 FL=1
MEDSSSELGNAWASVLADLQPNQRAWLRASEPVTLHGNTAIVAVPNVIHTTCNQERGEPTITRVT